MALDPGTAYTKARARASQDVKDVQDLLSWQQLGQMRAQQMRLQAEEAENNRWQKFYAKTQRYNDVLKNADPATREKMYKDMARSEGINVNSPEFKDQLKWLKGSDDIARQNLAQLNSRIAATAETPEQAAQLQQGVASGRISPKEAWEATERLATERTIRDRRAGKPSVASQGIVQTDRIAAPQPPAPKPNPVVSGAALNDAGKAVAGTLPGTMPNSPTNAYAGQAAGGIKGGTGYDPNTVAGAGIVPKPVPVNPAGAANKAAGFMQAQGIPQKAASAPPDGRMQGIMDSIAQRESGGDPLAKNPRSSAYGLFNYTSGTYLRSVKQQKPEWAEGLMNQEILATRADPEKQREIMLSDMYSNAALLERHGFQPTGANLYALHHFGMRGGIDLINAANNSPDTPISQLMPKSVIQANPYLRNHTAGSLVRSFELQIKDQAPGMEGDMFNIALPERGARQSAPAEGPSMTATPVQTLDKAPPPPVKSQSERTLDEAGYAAEKGNIPQANAFRELSEAEGKRELAAKTQKRSAESGIESIEQTRDAIDRLRNNPYAKYITGFGDKGIDVSVGGVRIAANASDVTAAADQIASAIPGSRAGNIANGINQAKADLEFIRGNSTIQAMAKSREGSAAGATGFGALDAGERKLLATVGSGGLNPSVGIDAFNDQLGNLDRILARQTEATKATAPDANIPTQAARSNTEETLQRAREELAKGPKPTTTDGMLEVIGKALGLW
jgi:hypothetical protein